MQYMYFPYLTMLYLVVTHMLTKNVLKTHAISLLEMRKKTITIAERILLFHFNIFCVCSLIKIFWFQVINDLLEDLTRLDSSERLALRGLDSSERMALRGLNNNDTARGKLTKQSSVLSGGSSRGSGPDSLLLETQTGADRVSTP
jgi:hypothetical protein